MENKGRLRLRSCLELLTTTSLYLGYLTHIDLAWSYLGHQLTFELSLLLLILLAMQFTYVLLSSYPGKPSRRYSSIVFVITMFLLVFGYLIPMWHAMPVR